MDHAVVFGAGLAGLLSARVLADRFERVTVVERDRLTRGPRRGVPQGRHAHALLPRGQEIIDELFPGVVEEMVAAGAVTYRPLVQARMVLGGNLMCRTPMPGQGLALTRPFLEDHVRRRLLALPGVELLDGWDAVGPVFRADAVAGARIGRPGEDRTLDANLVVDAMGRAGRAAVWLGESGFDRPAVEEVAVDVGYATCYLDLPDDAFGGDLLILIGSTPANPRGIALFRVEGERWILSAGGMCGDHPPTDHDGFLDYVATVVPPSMPDVLPALRAAPPPAEIVPARFPNAVRRRFDRLRRLPRGLIAAGDSICSVDPLYGQGMSAAALHAVALRDTLARGRDDLERRYFGAALRVTEPVWQLALSADLAFPGVPGEPPLASRLIGRYVGRVQRAATRDPSCAIAFARVVGLLDPPAALMRPAVVRQAIRHGSRS
ncbi:NAD(P)/FAD-dependent oxidoreductase [Nonomuraea sp. H19]|uniref:NAD(P)/FAD-dependent oxidoreductase n=1 Tax=Nonomuraea sp. H19 TaxID=3452206 RepID=UPI003F8B52EA